MNNIFSAASTAIYLFIWRCVHEIREDSEEARAGDVSSRESKHKRERRKWLCSTSPSRHTVRSEQMGFHIFWWYSAADVANKWIQSEMVTYKKAPFNLHSHPHLKSHFTKRSPNKAQLIGVVEVLIVTAGGFWASVSFSIWKMGFSPHQLLSGACGGFVQGFILKTFSQFYKAPTINEHLTN